MDAFLQGYMEDKGGENKKKKKGDETLPTDMGKGLKEFLSKRKREEVPIVEQSTQISKKKKIDIREERRQHEVEDPQLPKDWSIFTPDPETATTTVFLAPSFSGKTSLIVAQLNALTDHDLESYSGITLCTESISAAPLRELSERVLRKLTIFDGFLPDYVAYMKKTNTMTNNRFRYLVIMDDCLRLKGSTIVDMILTLRNSGVSTAISIQYSKLLTPAQRQSIHDYYLMNLRLEDLEYLLTGFIASHMRDKLNEEGDTKAYDYSIKKLAEAVRSRLKGYKILHYDQRHDKIKIYSSS
tara:strand:+ start:7347 stop:8240 length:894 start_codon:yes stop_codon:yes gene_type:complete